MFQFNTMSPASPPKPSTAIKYVRPAIARKLTRLVSKPPPSASSSFDAVMEFDGVRTVFVYTASVVSNVLPSVLKSTGPVNGAVHWYQIEWPPTSPACAGSLGCLLALLLNPLVVPNVPEMRKRLLKSSFTGGSMLRMAVPTAPDLPSTAIRYVVPAEAAKES